MIKSKYLEKYYKKKTILQHDVKKYKLQSIN